MLSELHTKLLDILSWFSDFCRQNELIYYIIEGTMLGAVRHKGFIPWDNDVDIGMPRKDYNKFLKLTAGICFGNFETESFHNGNVDFVYEFAKVYDNSTTLTENLRKPLRRGIYIDIFPLDGIGDTESECAANYRTIEFYRNLLSAVTCGYRKGRSPYKNMFVALGRLIPGFVANPATLLKKLECLVTRIDFDDAVFAGNLVSTYMEKEIMPRAWYGRPTEYAFHHLKVFGVEMYDKYLTHLYGDYLTPPQNRSTNHDYLLLDLQKPYKQVVK